MAAEDSAHPPGPPPRPDHPGPYGPHYDGHYHDDIYWDWMGFVIALIVLIVIVKLIILICWLCGRNRREGYVRLQGDGRSSTYHATDATAYTYTVQPAPTGYTAQPASAPPQDPPPYQNPYQAKDFSTMPTAPPAYTAQTAEPPPYSATRI